MRCVVDPVFHDVRQPMRRPPQSRDKLPQSLAATVSFEVGNILKEHYSWAEERDVVGHRREHAIVSIPAVMVPVAQLTESLARGARRKNFDVPDLRRVALH